ncbi:unnamed protein product [Arabis nemorensis]|uniref:ARID domain-containing protein n=1 Tax=Arabis nemorensis TaxID=586526 RepID=A0A565ASM8_9BRAS|nr:unnamed protein product [Arabis nemorensis]
MADTEMQEQDVPSGDVTVLVDTTKVEMLSPKSENENPRKRKTWLLSDSEARDVDEEGTPEEQKAFLRELETFHKENFLEFKAPKFYQKPLNTLKLWRAVIKLGGCEVVTTSKLWRQIGESFNPPKTCTTVSYTFRNFYEKVNIFVVQKYRIFIPACIYFTYPHQTILLVLLLALLEYEKYLRRNGELNLPGPTLMLTSSVKKEANGHQGGSGSGRARRDSAARAMQSWHAQRLVGPGEVTEPIAKEKGLNSAPKHKKLKTIGLPKQETQTSMDLAVSHEVDQQSFAGVVDVGPLADWVKINVKETKDSFEIFALVPGLLRKEVRIQSDPAGKLVITGQPEQLDNPWGITPFKKVVDLSARIDPLHTSAVMSMHGRLFIRVPFEQIDCQE